jgi:xanthine dehydrogenase YagS FAD-binding subunit
MRPYDFAAPHSVRAALDQASEGSAYLAGGTTLVDLMKLEVLTPRRVLDINRLPLRGIWFDGDGLHIGALERMSDVAEDPRVRTRYPVISEALALSASQQVRNMASMGGNLLQRTRCGYFRDAAMPCNKREPASGCSALTGANRGHAVLGTSASCVATHPSDLAVALVALDARLDMQGPGGARTLPLASFYRLPADTPHLENELRPGELITSIAVPPLPFAANSRYVKVRDRQSYEFALASVALALDLRGDTIVAARVAAGGVGTRPWRLTEVEHALAGKPTTAETYEVAAAHAADGAHTLTHNAYKPALLRRTVVRALTAMGGSG